MECHKLNKEFCKSTTMVLVEALQTLKTNPYNLANTKIKLKHVLQIIIKNDA